MEFTFKLTELESQKLLDTLVKEPYIEVVDIINKIQQQASEQMNEKHNKSNKNPFFAEMQEGESNGI